jgi:hypothetical protein
VASFDKIVAVKFGEEWVPVDSADLAMNCLRELWPDTSGPSYHRAVRNCQAHLAGDATMLAARASFMVAAMEAGFPFEIYLDHLAFMDAQIASVAKEQAVNEWDDTERRPGSEFALISARSGAGLLRHILPAADRGQSCLADNGASPDRHSPGACLPSRKTRAAL